MIPLPIRLEPVGEQEPVRLYRENPAVGAGLQHILTTVGDGSARERKVFHTMKGSCFVFSMIHECETIQTRQKR